MKLVAALALAAALALSSCLGPKPLPEAPHQAQFVESEWTWAAAEGTASVGGELFSTKLDGSTARSSGTKVYLMPDNPYAREIAWNLTTVVTAHAGKTSMFGPTDERANIGTRVVTSDSNGMFRFERLPPGKYLIAASQIVYVPSGGRWITWQGLSYVQPVDLAEGQSASVSIQAADGGSEMQFL